MLRGPTSNNVVGCDDSQGVPLCKGLQGSAQADHQRMAIVCASRAHDGRHQKGQGVHHQQRGLA